MKQQCDRVAGLDVHRDSVVACVRLGRGDEPQVRRRSFKTTTAGVDELARWLADFEVTRVVMESTGVYWKPVYYPLEGLFAELWLVNAAHVKNVPGRKTDPSGWLMWPRTGWCGRLSCPTRRCASCGRSPAIARAR